MRVDLLEAGVDPQVAQSRTLGAQLVAVVQLYRALGGGWTPDGTRAERR